LDDQLNTTEENSLPKAAFIVGMGRSGTTLLTNMLNSHPEIIATPENEFMLFSYSTFFNKNFSITSNTKAFVDMCSYNFSNIVSIWKPSVELSADINNLKEKSYANVCKLVYLNYPLANKNKITAKYVVDKNPIYSLHIPKLNRVYPDAKYIVLIRDFRDNTVSRKKYGKTNESIFKLAASWNYFYEKIFADISKYHTSHMILRYEDLANDPEQALNKICLHLGISYSESMLHFKDLISKTREHAKQNLSNEVYQKITEMHSNLDKEVNTNRINAYEKELSTEEILILNCCCEKLGKQFNYLSPDEPTAYKLSWKLKYFVAKSKVILYYRLKNIYYRLPVKLRLAFLKKQ
jgi:hypothetical protein